MKARPQQETNSRDLSVPAACAACDGEVAVRLTPGRARGVCLACHLVTDLALTRAPEGLRLVQVTQAAA